VPLSIDDFFAAMNEHQARVPLDELTELMTDLQVTMDDVQDVARFGDETYQRNLWHEGTAYQALVLCWRPGQRSPIHDHRGSSCGVRVLKGVLTETTFDRTPEGLIYATGSGELRTGDICGSEDRDIHQVSNLRPPGEDLVTLHVYSPPLLTMGVYSLTDAGVSDFRDPVVGFVGGAGI